MVPTVCRKGFLPSMFSMLFSCSSDPLFVPSFSCSSEPTVLFYDEKEANLSQPAKAKRVTGKSVPVTPTNRAAAQKRLDDKKKTEDDRYVYLPPGSSMRDPGYNSMSDPLERRVYYRDPVPATKKK